MDHYVNSKDIERNWFDWATATFTPQLEPYRRLGLLYTKNESLPCGRINPYSPRKEHIINIGRRIKFESVNGNVDTILPLMMPIERQIIKYGFTISNNNIDTAFKQETPTNIAWNRLVQEINLMCQGISKKFSFNEEDRDDLAHGALVVVLSKLERNKLIYKPGKAPVFSLLTTTIHRCMFSILSRKTKQNQHQSTLVEGLTSGRIRPLTRSLSLFAGSTK